MKVNGPSGIGATSAPGKPAPTGQGGSFRLPAADALAAPVQIARTNSLSGIMNVGALLALQDVGGPLERKRRAVARAGRLLDVLEDMKLALLDGELSSDDIYRLRQAIRDQRDQTDDPGLEDILNHIETRAAVELAKREQANNS